MASNLVLEADTLMETMQQELWGSEKVARRLIRDKQNHSEQVNQIRLVKNASTQGLVAFTVLRAVAPQVAIPLSIAYGAYCLLQKDEPPP